ncbi:H-NS histone family protein [Burkholderia vietnamiensis]|uniref:H-NS histone family protein n=1 Tax=Burkholderia vietnamiensis TaxID=60552 RepID=UPI001D14BFA8|nr:H-NS histone family protein [Burkholderia vietnamiensis]UEB99677.1 H-NS histone family protein [Burkholderia vietnamiensis]
MDDEAPVRGADPVESVDVQVVERRHEDARVAEFQAVVDDIRSKIAEYGITEKDIFGTRRGRPAKQATVQPEAKYRDPKTGATWSGRGRAPAWIKDAKNRNRFLIQQ